MLEREGSFVAAGACIVLAPNAVRVLSELDVVDTLGTQGYLPETTIPTDQHGRELRLSTVLSVSLWVSWLDGLRIDSMDTGVSSASERVLSAVGRRRGVGDVRP